MIKVVLLAPIQNSLYARLVSYALTKEKGVALAAIIVRSHWNIKRFGAEFNRDGSRLIRKIYQKLVIGDDRYSTNQIRNLAVLSQAWQLPYKSLNIMARKLGIEYAQVLDHNHPASVQLIKRINPDLILFTGGGIIRQPLLDIPHYGIINCHTGILPNYRGMDVVEWTALEGKIKSIGFGATLHAMDKGVDTGPILLKKQIFPNTVSTFDSIRAELEVEMVHLMIEGVRGFVNGMLHPKPQSLEEGKQYFIMHPRIKLAAETRLISGL